MPTEYDKMNVREVYDFLDKKLPKKNVHAYEIGCGNKSAEAIERLKKEGRVISYEGYDISSTSADATAAHGLETCVVGVGYDHRPGFKETANKGPGATLIMLGLGYVAKKDAEVYTQQAREAGLNVVSLPEL